MLPFIFAAVCRFRLILPGVLGVSAVETFLRPKQAEACVPRNGRLAKFVNRVRGSVIMGRTRGD